MSAGELLRSNSREPIILIDTNTVMLVGEGYNLFEDILLAIGTRYKCILPFEVVEEISRIWYQLKPSERKKARWGLTFILNKCSLERLSSNVNTSDVDKIILEQALKLKNMGFKVFVATSDRELRAVLRSNGIPSIYFREESRRFEVEWQHVI